jgi:predicted ATP-dependent endonuclease of OLD family
VHKTLNYQYFFDNMNKLYGLYQPTFVPAVRPFGNMHISDNHDLILGQGVIAQWVAEKQSNKLQARKSADFLEREIARIFGYDHIDITANNGNTDFIVKINNDKSYVLKDMGNGISHFISLLINIPNRGNPIILIDEPEIGIHASLQTELINMLLRYATGPIIFATHSIGLARGVADEIISFSMDDGASRSSSFKESPSHLETLGEMSFSAWREIGCNGVLFVEGPSEIKVFSEWLKLLGLHRNWAVLSLGGSETIHAAGVDAIKQVIAIHPNVAVIIDSERDVADAALDNKRAAFVKACGDASIHCLATERKATENYYTQQAITAAIGPNARSLEAFEKLNGHGWGKRDGFKIASKMNKEELDSTDVGRFLRTITNHHN